MRLTWQVFEEYQGTEAVKRHFENEEFKALGKMIEEGKASIKFITYDEEL